MANNSYYPGPSHPPPHSLGNGVVLTEQAIKSHEAALTIKWSQLLEVPAEFGGDAPAAADIGYTVLDIAGDATAGLTGTGTDRSATFAGLTANVGYILRPGVYRVASNITIPSCTLYFAPGAMIQPDNGVKITWGAHIGPTLHKIFTTVQTGGMIRFSRGGVSEVFPEWWGATSNNAGDSSFAINAAFDSGDDFPIADGGGLVMKFQGGAYRYGQPIRQTRNCWDVQGVGGDKTNLVPAYAHGPSFVAYPKIGYGSLADVLGPPLLAGGGNAFALDVGIVDDPAGPGALTRAQKCNAKWLNLRDSKTLDLYRAAVSGKSAAKTTGAFAVECAFKPLELLADGSIVGSCGTKWGESSPNSAFRLGLVGGKYQGHITAGGVMKTVTSTTNAVIGTQVYLAMTYDGTNLRMYVNGVLEHTVAATGNITQELWEEVTVGPQLGKWPESDHVINSVVGYVDNLRISNVARYTGGTHTVPTVKFGSEDINTLALLTFDYNFDIFTRMRANSGIGFAWLRHNQRKHTYVDTCSFSDIWFDGGGSYDGGVVGPVFTYYVAGKIERVRYSGESCGMYLWNNCYEASVRGVNLSCGGRWALALAPQCGVMYFEHILLTGGIIQFVNYSGSGVMNGGWFSAQGQTIAHVMLDGSDGFSIYSFNGTVLAAESGAPDLIASQILVSMPCVTYTGCTMESETNVISMLDGGRLNLFGTTMRPYETAAQLIHIPAYTNEKVYVIGCQNWNTTPWCNEASALSLL